MKLGETAQWLAIKPSIVTVWFYYTPADHSVNEDDPQIRGSHGLLSHSHDLQTLSEEITQLETITMVTREFLHFLGK